MKVTVYIEEKEGRALNVSLEALGAAAQIGKAEAVAESDSGAAAAADCGVPVTVFKTEGCQDTLVAALERYIDREKPDIVLLGATQAGKDVAPRLAQRLGAACITDVVEIKENHGEIIFVRPGFGGSVYEEMAVCGDRVTVATIHSGYFERPAAAGTAPAAEKTFAVDRDDIRVKLVESVQAISEKVDLENARVIVTGGRGMGDEAGFRLVEELAEVLGGEVGVSRPAMEAGWASRVHQVGQSGKTVAPKLYIACGVSGAAQHVSAIIKSNYIVAINKDADAPIFELADLGIVGDVKVILPMLIEEFKKRRRQELQ